MQTGKFRRVGVIAPIGIRLEHELNHLRRHTPKLLRAAVASRCAQATSRSTRQNDSLIAPGRSAERHVWSALGGVVALRVELWGYGSQYTQSRSPLGGSSINVASALIRLAGYELLPRW